MSPALPSPRSAVGRRVLTADLVATAVFPLAITGSTAVVPFVQRDLDASLGSATWVVLAYNVTFSAALLAAGRIADRTDRARFFAFGNLIVALTGVASAMATSAHVLITLRVVAGPGAAMCAAGGSSMILAAFPPALRPRVYRYSGAVLGAGLALGPLVSQALIAAAGWRAVFVAPALPALLAAVTAFRLPDWAPDTSHVDAVGVTTFALLDGSGCTTLGVAGMASPWAVVAGAAVTLVLGVAFVRGERRSTHPALPLDLLKIPQFRWYAASSGAFMGCLVSALTLLPLLPSLNASPLLTSAALVSVTAMPAVLPLMTGPVTSRAPRLTVHVALLGCAAAAALIAAAPAAAGHATATLLSAALLVGVCLGITQGVPDGQALSHVSATRGGAGAALFSTTRMTIETLVLAATTGAVAIAGVHTAALVSAAACLLVLLTTPLNRGG